MTLLDKIPTMTDEDLATLLANAIRLSDAGTRRQQEEAAQLLPALTEETESRTARTLAAAAERRAKRPKSARKKAVAAVAETADVSDEA